MGQWQVWRFWIYVCMNIPASSWRSEDVVMHLAFTSEITPVTQDLLPKSWIFPFCKVRTGLKAWGLMLNMCSIKRQKRMSRHKLLLYIFCSCKSRCWKSLFWLQVSVSIISSFVCFPYTCRKISLLWVWKIFATLLILFNWLISRLATLDNNFLLLCLLKVPQKYCQVPKSLFVDP